MKINKMDSMSYELKEKTAIIHQVKEKKTIVQKKAFKASNHLSQSVGQYNALGKELSIDAGMKSIGMDKGTAAETTVLVNRNAFDAIVSYSTFNEPKWEELGVDNEKRWVVINGQRFEVPHSAEEIALRKRTQGSLVDFLDAYDEHKELQGDNNNKEILKDNKSLVDLLEKIFSVDSFEALWQVIV